MAKTLSRNLLVRMRIQLSILIVTVLAVLVMDSQGWVLRLENALFDYRITQTRSATVLPSAVKVVLIDESSMAKMSQSLGQFPWPRTVYAELLEFFDMAGAQAVLFDILFTEPERAQFGNSDSLSDHDARLVEATAEFPFSVHAAMFNLDTIDEELNDLNQALPPGVVEKFSIKQVQSNGTAKLNSFTLPLPELTAASSHLGLVGADPDEDGIYRRLRLLWPYQGDYFPAFSLAPLLINEPDPIIVSSPYQMRFNDRVIPTDKNDRLLINVYGDYRPYPIARVFQAYDQIKKGELDQLAIDPYEFENAVVFIGASAVGLEDIKSLANNRKAPGVYLHAAAYGNIIDDDGLRIAQPWVTRSAVIAAAMLALVLIFMVPSFSLKIALLSALPVAWWFVTGRALEQNWVMAFSLPVLALLLTTGASFTYLSFTEGATKKRVKRMLSQYVSAAMLDQAMAQSDDILHAGDGVEEELSILFSDIRGFTNFSETLPAVDVVRLLNCHFSEMSEVIFNNSGTLDKFIGDAMMAFWGAPIQVNNHADLAVKAALDMLVQIVVVNQLLADKQLPPIEIGIGINTGRVILGNIGSDRKLDYTVIGDAVNLASRMEGITKSYGVPLVISESTRLSLQTDRPCLILDHVRVKGKLQPVPIYLPLPNQQEEPDNYQQHLDVASNGQAAFAAYQAGNWSEAESLYALLPFEKLRDLYLARIASFRVNSLPENWDGVYTFESK